MDDKYIALILSTFFIKTVLVFDFVMSGYVHSHTENYKNSLYLPTIQNIVDKEDYDELKRQYRIDPHFIHTPYKGIQPISWVAGYRPAETQEKVDEISPRTQNTIEMLGFLLDRDADIHSKDKNQMTPLSYACLSSDPSDVKVKILKMLLDYRRDIDMIDVNVRDEDGYTPLMILAHEYIHNGKNQNNLECMRILLSYGADVNVRSDYGTSINSLLVISLDDDSGKLVKLISLFEPDLTYLSTEEVRLYHTLRCL